LCSRPQDGSDDEDDERRDPNSTHAGLRLFFSGDFDGFAEIGHRFGPFDVAMVETGAYDARWSFVHMQPEQTLQAYRDLRGRWLLPIHNGTFDLAMHAWDEPFERISALAADHGVALATPRIGERLDLRPGRPGRGGATELQSCGSGFSRKLLIPGLIVGATEVATASPEKRRDFRRSHKFVVRVLGRYGDDVDSGPAGSSSI